MDDKITPDYDEGSLELILEVEEGNDDTQIQVMIYDQELKEQVYEGFFSLCEKIKFEITDFRAWSPEEPYLYQLFITVGKDKIKSYFAI